MVFIQYKYIKLNMKGKLMNIDMRVLTSTAFNYSKFIDLK